MAVLPVAIRQEIWADFMRRFSSRREPIGALSKADLQAAVNATDGWIDTNAAAFNLALPIAARNALSAAQKAELFSLVALRRYSG